MTDLPREVRQVFNARARDAHTAMNEAIEQGDREAFVRAMWDLVWVVEEEDAAKRDVDRL